MAIRGIKSFKNDPNYLLNYLTDFNISEKIDTLYFTLSFSNSRITDKRILKVEKKSGHEVNTTDLVLNDTWKEPYEFLKRAYLSEFTDAFHAKCYDNITLGFFYIPTRVPRTIDYTYLYDKGDKLILSYIGEKNGRRLKILRSDEIMEKFKGFESYHPLKLLNKVSNKTFNVIDLKRVNIKNESNTDFLNLISRFCDDEISEYTLLREILIKNGLTCKDITLSHNEVEDVEGFILDVNNSNKMQIQNGKNRFISEFDMSTIKIYHDVFLKNFILFLKKYVDTIDCKKVLLDSSLNYIDTVSHIFTEYINNLSDNEFKDFDLSSDKLQLPIIGHRGDIDYDYINNGYCVSILKVDELYKNMYLIVLSSLRFYKTPDNERNSLIDNEEYLIWNRMVQSLSKKQR